MVLSNLKNLIIDQCDRQPTRAFFATLLDRGSKSPRTAILRNQEARGATSAKRVPQDVPTTEIGQRTKLSGLDRPQQDSQPHSWRAQTRGFRSPYGTQQGDPIKSSVMWPADAALNLPTKLDGRLSRTGSSDHGSIVRCSWLLIVKAIKKDIQTDSKSGLSVRRGTHLKNAFI